MAVPGHAFRPGRDAPATGINFKTTVVLIVLLLVAGVALFFTRDRGTGEEGEKTAKKAQKVFDVTEHDITKLAIVSNDGKKPTLEKSDGGKWRLSDPVNAPADSFNADALVRSVASLESRGEFNSA